LLYFYAAVSDDHPLKLALARGELVSKKIASQQASHLLIALRQRLLLLPEAISAAGPEKQKPKPKKVVAKRK
jgi:hypothetical protein